MEALPSVGDVLASKYRLEAELGRGGMGAVFRARHLVVQKDFAIKVLLDPSRGQFASRFVLEAQAAGRIGHPGILQVYDFGDTAEGYPFLVMELLDGAPLSNLLADRRLPIDSACWVAIELLDVLEAAHRAGVVHRDIKPQNVFLLKGTPPGAGEASGLKLLDFGIAKFQDVPGSVLTRSGEIIGTPLYMAPEQAKGDPAVDARADLWSVGAMLFEMLTGTCAHASTTPIAVLAKILTEPAEPPSRKSIGIPKALDDIVLRALRINANDRFSSAAEMKEALNACLASIGRSAIPPPLPSLPKHATSAQSPRAMPYVMSSTLQAPPTSVASSVSVPPEQALKSARPRATRPLVIGAVALFLGLLAGGIATAFLAARTSADAVTPSLSARLSAPSIPSDTTLSAAAQASATASTAAPAASPLGNEPSSETAPGKPAVKAIVSPGKASVAPSGRTARPSPSAEATCGAGEELSAGHCCPRGTSWVEGRCERPLAKTF